MTPSLFGPISLSLVTPELVLALAGCVALLTAQFQNSSLRRSGPIVTLVAVLVALLIVRLTETLGVRIAGQTLAGSRLVFDGFADFVRLATLFVGLLVVLVCWTQPRDEERGEFWAMMNFMLCGLLLVGSASDLVLLFLAIELVSIPTYLLVVLGGSGPRALEAGTKYFYLGALSAAITAYGLSLIYGAMGQAAIDGVGAARFVAALAEPGTLAHGVASAGLLLTIGGLLFKLAAVPLHFYVAEVYQGAASCIAGLLGFVPKFAGLVAILKIVGLTGWNMSGGLFWTLWIVALASMTIGNVLALWQHNVKRMLAYSGVAHAGYMLVGVIAAAGHGGVVGDGSAAVLYYIVIYGVANLGAFALLEVLTVRGQPCETVRDLAGLLRRAPVEALLMALAMFTLMGLPPTPGFWGKLTLFGSALSVSNAPSLAMHQPWLVALVVLAVVNSAIAAAYYLRVIAAVLLYENDDAAERLARPAQQYGALVCGLLLLAFSFYPNGLLSAGQMAAQSLRESVASVYPPPGRVVAEAPAAR